MGRDNSSMAYYLYLWEKLMVGSSKKCEPKLLNEEQKEIINKLIVLQQQYKWLSEEGFKELEAFPNDSQGNCVKRTVHIGKLTFLAVKHFTEFSRRVPGFDSVVQEDQIILLENCRNEVMMLNTSRKVDMKTISMNLANNQLFTKENCHCVCIKDRVDSVFNFCRTMCILEVDDVEHALLTAIAIFTERPHLLEPKKVQKIREFYIEILKSYVATVRPLRNNDFSWLLFTLVKLRTLRNIVPELCVTIRPEDEKCHTLLQQVRDIPQQPCLAKIFRELSASSNVPLNAKPRKDKLMTGPCNICLPKLEGKQWLSSILIIPLKQDEFSSKEDLLQMTELSASLLQIVYPLDKKPIDTLTRPCNICQPKLSDKQKNVISTLVALQQHYESSSEEDLIQMMELSAMQELPLNAKPREYELVTGMCSICLPDLLNDEQKKVISTLVLLQRQYQSPSEEDLLRMTAFPLGDNDEDFTKRFKHISQFIALTAKLVVEFSKRVPGFGTFSQEYQTNLLKESSLKVVLLWAARNYHMDTDSVIWSNNQPYRREDYLACMGDSVDSVFDFCRAMYTLKLDEAEYALLAAIIIFEDPRLLEAMEMQKFYLLTLRFYIAPKRPTDSFYKLISLLADVQLLGTMQLNFCFNLDADQQLYDFLRRLWNVGELPFFAEPSTRLRLHG